MNRGGVIAGCLIVGFFFSYIEGGCSTVGIVSGGVAGWLIGDWIIERFLK